MANTTSRNQKKEAARALRLNKYIARAGVTSRRKADGLIEAGRVEVNGEQVTQLGARVERSDVVAVDGDVLSLSPRVYLLLNKPQGVITTKDDEHGRGTVMDLINLPPEEKEALFPVGRLDRDTVGVLLFTTDGDLGHRLMHPRYEVEKLYLVETATPVAAADVDRLREGVRLEDGSAAAEVAQHVRPADKTRLMLALHEGRNRQIRRMLGALGYDVTRLERTSFAGLTPRGVPRGDWRRLTEEEVDRLEALVGLDAASLA